MTNPGEELAVLRRMKRRRLLLPILVVRTMSRSVSALSAAASRRSGGGDLSNLRVELFFSSADELTQRVEFLKSKGVVSYNLVREARAVVVGKADADCAFSAALMIAPH